MIFALGLSLTNASTVKIVSIRAGEQETVFISLQAKQTVTGSFNVTGSGQDIIDFWVRNPKGEIILNSGTVADRGNFAFTADSDGEYALNFKNNIDYRKSVNLEYEVNSPSIIDVISPQNMGVDPLVFAGLIIAVGAVLAIMGFAFYRRSHAKKVNNQPPPP